MDEQSHELQNIDPRLLALIKKVEGIPGLCIRNLQEGDILEVKTNKILYTMRVLDPKSGRVSVKSDRQPTPQENIGTIEIEGTILGTSLTDAEMTLKMGWILLGFRLVLGMEKGGLFGLAPTREVRVNGIKLFHIEAKA